MDGNNNGTALAEISAARQALARAQDIYAVLEIRDIAKAAATLAEAQNAGDAANEAKEVQLRAERKAGTFLKTLERRPGGDGSNQHVDRDGLNAQSDYAATMEDAGIPRTTAKRWQKIADVPEEEFERFVIDTKEGGKELTQAGVLSLERKLNRPTLDDQPPIPNGKYRVIYADPPWKYGNIMPDYYYEQADHYPLLTVREICELPVEDLAQDNAVLFLWTTSPILEEAFDVISAWGFKYKASFVWDKVKHNMGHYNSVRHEYLLVCVRGSCQPDVRKLFDSVQSIERTEHSVKPEEFREIIDTIYPHGERIELFARREVPGWEVWGNEAKSATANLS